ncbi:MAG: septal ring lytic transglycosylase RlpA family protein [Hyphomonadaceae bacterium]|nr:septal ring lytic transglycosylase RlpA family protein [Hyphomonadaceae bacterium]
MMMRWDSTSRFALAAACVLGLSAPGALAQSSRDLAPIIYKTPDGPTPGTQVQVPARAGGQLSIPAQGVSGPAARPRIEFRYPDQPNRIYSGGAAEAAQTSPQAARQYAHVDTTPVYQQPVSPSPAPSAGGFDARATAARIAAQQQAAAAQASQPQPQPAADSYSLPGTLHQPQQVASYDETGIASTYGDGFQGQPTANGEIYDENILSAAHPSLPLPSLVQVINPQTGRELVVRVNDRGPFVDGRMIDLSPKAATMLGFQPGTEAEVRVRYLGPAAVQAGPEPRWVADTVETTSARPVTEVELPGLSETVAPAPQPAPAVSAQPVLQPTPNYQATANGAYFVQIGSFANIGNAERLSRSLDAGVNVKVVPARVNNADYFRVWVGPYSSHGHADRVRADMARRGVAQGVVVNGR